MYYPRINRHSDPVDWLDREDAVNAVIAGFIGSVLFGVLVMICM